MISEIRRLDPSEPWSLELSEPDEIAAVRPVWAFALANGRTLTRKHAAWAVKVLAAAPDLPINDVWGISGLYALGTFDRTGIDPLIAMGPWRDIEHCERYFKAANDGTIKVPYPALNLALRIPEQNPEIEAPETAAYCARIPEEITVVVEASNKTRHPESHSDKARERSRIVRKDI
jgi:hypothetical protein